MYAQLVQDIRLSQLPHRPPGNKMIDPLNLTGGNRPGDKVDTTDISVCSGHIQTGLQHQGVQGQRSREEAETRAVQDGEAHSSRAGPLSQVTGRH